MKNFSSEQLPDILMRIEERLEKMHDILLETYKQYAPEDDFIGSKEAAKILKFSLPTLYTKVCKREVPFYKQGNRLYFSKQKLLDWIQDGKKKSLNEINSEALQIAKKMEKRGSSIK
jgi:excisionase family DNA binding protein